MAFRVVYDAEGTNEDFGADDRYRFDDGLLVVERADGVRRTYSPHAWMYVEEQRERGGFHSV